LLWGDGIIQTPLHVAGYLHRGGVWQLGLVATSFASSWRYARWVGEYGRLDLVEALRAAGEALDGPPSEAAGSGVAATARKRTRHRETQEPFA
jgi:hypothetical protein